MLAGAALAVQPLIGHAGAIGGSLGIELIASEALHLFAAGAWLGGLLPLFIAIRILPAQAAASACHGFTPIGLSAVVVLAGTAVVQVVQFIGGMPGLFGTAYGHIALLKVGLLLAPAAACSAQSFRPHRAHHRDGAGCGAPPNALLDRGGNRAGCTRGHCGRLSRIEHAGRA